MAHNINIDCYKFHIKPKYSGTDRVTNFKNLIAKYLSEKETLDDNYEDCFLRFFSDFRGSLGSEFKINSKRTKGIAISTTDPNRISHRRHTISGVFKGGDTGIEKFIHERNDVTNAENLNQFKISALPCYYKFWLPPDSNLGIAIVQSYGNEKMGGFLVDQLRKFISSKGITIENRNKFLPRTYIEHFKENSVINSMTITKSILDRDIKNNLNPLLRDINDLKVDLVFKGFGGQLSWSNVLDFMNGHNNVFFSLKLPELALEEGYDTIIEYNYEGKSARGKLSTSFNIIPSLIINDHITVNANGHPDFESLNNYCNNLLDDLISEIGYIVEEQEF